MMTVPDVRSILFDVLETAKVIFQKKPHSVILYGSYARGDYDNESDIDILILADISNQECNNYRRKFSTVVDKLSLQYDIVVSLHILDIDTFERWNHVVPFYQTVKREGVVISA